MFGDLHVIAGQPLPAASVLYMLVVLPIFRLVSPVDTTHNLYIPVVLSTSCSCTSCWHFPFPLLDCSCQTRFFIRGDSHVRGLACHRGAAFASRLRRVHPRGNPPFLYFLMILPTL